MGGGVVHVQGACVTGVIVTWHAILDGVYNPWVGTAHTARTLACYALQPNANKQNQRQAAQRAALHPHHMFIRHACCPCIRCTCACRRTLPLPWRWPCSSACSASELRKKCSSAGSTSNAPAARLRLSHTTGMRSSKLMGLGLMLRGRPSQLMPPCPSLPPAAAAGAEGRCCAAAALLGGGPASRGGRSLPAGARWPRGPRAHHPPRACANGLRTRWWCVCRA